MKKRKLENPQKPQKKRQRNDDKMIGISLECDNIIDIPKYIINKCFGFLSIKDNISCNQTCKTFYDTINMYGIQCNEKLVINNHNDDDINTFGKAYIKYYQNNKNKKRFLFEGLKSIKIEVYNPKNNDGNIFTNLKYFKQLISISIQNKGHDYELLTQIGAHLSNNKNVNNFEFKSTQILPIKIDCFVSLIDKAKHIYLENCLITPYIVNALNKPVIHDLSLYNVCYIDNNQFKPSFPHMSQCSSQIQLITYAIFISMIHIHISLKYNLDLRILFKVRNYLTNYNISKI